ncbi:MAG: hypothetical protein P8046_14740, partial [Anaerolineales bacterium]
MNSIVRFWYKNQNPRHLSNTQDQQDYILRVILISSVLVLSVSIIRLIVVLETRTQRPALWDHILIPYIVISIIPAVEADHQTAPASPRVIRRISTQLSWKP